MTHGQPREGFYKVHGYVTARTLESLERIGVPNLSKAVTVALEEWAHGRGAHGSEPHPVEG